MSTSIRTNFSDTLMCCFYDAVGDFISTCGMVHYLSRFYKRILIVTDLQPVVLNLYNGFPEIRTMSYNDKEQLTNTTQKFDVMDVHLNEEYVRPGRYQGHYFDKHNPIGVHLGFQIQKDSSLDNASRMYNYLGLPPFVKYDYFAFNRMRSEENKVFDSLNIKEPYIVSSGYDGNGIPIKTTKRIVNLHRLASDILFLVRVIEEADEVHLLENSIALMVYHLQIAGLMRRVPVYFHAYARKESHRVCSQRVPDNEQDLNMFVRMTRNPLLPHWKFIWSSSGMDQPSFGESNQNIEKPILFLEERKGCSFITFMLGGGLYNLTTNRLYQRDDDSQRYKGECKEVIDVSPRDPFPIFVWANESDEIIHQTCYLLYDLIQVRKPSQGDVVISSYGETIRNRRNGDHLSSLFPFLRYLFLTRMKKDIASYLKNSRVFIYLQDNKTQDDMTQILLSRGFQCVDLQKCSMREKICLFHTSSVIVFENCDSSQQEVSSFIWAVGSETKIIEVSFSPSSPPSQLQDISTVLGTKYHKYEGDGISEFEKYLEQL